MTALAPILEAFFTERLLTQRQASAHTVASYRDTFRLLLRFAAAAPRANRHRGWTSTDLDARVHRCDSSTTSKPTGATACAPATTGWPRSTRCSATPRCATPNTPT